MYFDIGANIGNFTKENINNATQIICIEASPSTFKILQKNLKEFKHVTCLNYAVSDTKNDTVTFYQSSYNTLSTLNKNWLISERSRFGNQTSISEIEVKTISIDKLIKLYGIPSLIKVDVEGAENIVLKSLTQKVPLLCFEWAAEWLNENIECVEYLTKLGFFKFDIQLHDNYTYHPQSFNYTKDSLIEKLKNAKFKVDWGMVWCS